MANRRIVQITFIGIIILAAACVVVYRSLTELSAIARLASCRPSLIYRASQLYASDNGGVFPPLSPIPGRFTYDTDRLEIYAFHVRDHICEFDAEGPREGEMPLAPLDRVDDWSYVYVGYVIENEQQGLALLNAYSEWIATGRFTDAMNVPAGTGNGGGTRLHQLQLPDSFTGDNSYLREKASEIPVIIEWPGNHGKRGAKVVFLDGHEEVIPYPGKFPMTERFISALRTLDESYPAYNPE